MLKKQVANTAQLKNFDMHKDIRILCDASHNGLGAVLEQLGPRNGGLFYLRLGF